MISRVRLSITLLGFGGVIWAIVAGWSLYRGVAQLSWRGDPSSSNLDEQLLLSTEESPEAPSSSPLVARAPLLHPEQLGSQDATRTDLCGELRGSTYSYQHLRRHISISENLPVGFQYLEASDQELSDIAIAGDGTAQSVYVNRLHEAVLLDRSKLDSGGDLKSWERQFDAMRNFYIMLFKSGNNNAAWHLAEKYWWQSPKRDLIEASAWLYLSEMTGDEGHEQFETVPFTAEQKRAGRELAGQYIELYDLGFLRGLPLPAFVGDVDAANGLSESRSVAEDVHQTGCSASAEPSAESAPADWYSSALVDLAMYERAVEQNAGIENDAIRRDLNQRFSAVRRQLIVALRRGDVSALATLIRIHTGVENREDPLEAGAWREVGRLVYAFEATDRSDPQESESDDVESLMRLRARQYISIFGLK